MTNNLPLKNKYSAKSAGRLITNKVPVASIAATVADVEKLLLKDTKNFDTINYVYVTDKDNKLVGVFSIKELFRSPKNTLVKELLPPKIIKARPHTHQERVAYLALKNSLKAIPIIDKDDKFLGVVPSDEILSILDSEAVENLLRFGGIMHYGVYDNIFNISIFKSLKHRLPWLVVGALGGMLAAIIINNFEEVLSRRLILAAFIPLVVYLAAAVSGQTQAFIIRDLAFESKINFLRYFARQFIIIFLIAIIISALVLVGGLFLFGELAVGLVLSLALLIAILSSIFSGLIVPLIFARLNFDPANASGPVATIIQDILSVLVYLSIAAWLL